MYRLAGRQLVLRTPLVSTDDMGIHGPRMAKVPRLPHCQIVKKTRAPLRHDAEAQTPCNSCAQRVRLGMCSSATNHLINRHISKAFKSIYEVVSKVANHARQSLTSKKIQKAFENK